MKFVQVMDVHEEDNSATVLCYEVPDDFAPPVDWHKLSIEGFVPNIPSDEAQIDRNMALVGVITTEIDE